MRDEFVEIRGIESGPTSVILAGVHGNEICGVEAFKKLLPDLRIKRGSVWFGYGNPRAIKANKRFMEANLNRMFKPDEFISAEDRNSYEYGRAQFIKQYLDKADALLDIHASNTQRSKPFIVCEENANGIAKYLPFDLVVSGLSKLEPGCTDYYMNSVGKIGIGVECGYLGDKSSAVVAMDSIIAFLVVRGHVEMNQKIEQQKFINMDYLYFTKSNKFQLAKLFEDFENVSEGQMIGFDGAEEVCSPKDGIILFARDRSKIGDEAFLLGKKIGPT